MKTQLKKKLVTVVWSVTMEVDLPEDVGLDELTSLVAPNDIYDKAADIVYQAYGQLGEQEGVITDVQDQDDEGE